MAALKLNPLQILRPSITTQWLCLACQNRIAVRLIYKQHGPRIPHAARKQGRREPLPEVGTPHPSRREREKPLQPLMTPIGQPSAPKPGDNPHNDPRSWRQKVEDYFNRHEASRQWHKPQFKAWKDMRHHSGKRFLATPKPFKSEAALYFPNFQGYTLAEPNGIHDTTQVLRGKVSVVRVTNEYWSVMQCDSWTDNIWHPELGLEMERLKDKGVQMVNITLSEMLIKAWIQRMNVNWARKQRPQEQWPRCFVVRKGFTDYTTHDIHMSNTKVGHIYVIDENCKIRFAGAGGATDEERECLLDAVRRLAEPEEYAEEKRRLAQSDFQSKEEARHVQTKARRTVAAMNN